MDEGLAQVARYLNYIMLIAVWNDGIFCKSHPNSIFPLPQYCAYVIITVRTDVLSHTFVYLSFLLGIRFSIPDRNDSMNDSTLTAEYIQKKIFKISIY